MAGLCTFLDIYPEAIEKADRIAMNALKENGFLLWEINNLYDNLNISSDDFVAENVTNNIIEELFDLVRTAIMDRHPEKDVSVYVNCYDSHIIIDGEQVSC